MKKRSWAGPSRRTRLVLLFSGIVQVALLVAAQVDLARRPASHVLGSKTRWRLLTLINFAGPVAYFLRGRRTSTLP